MDDDEIMDDEPTARRPVLRDLSEETSASAAGGTASKHDRDKKDHGGGLAGGGRGLDNEFDF